MAKTPGRSTRARKVPSTAKPKPLRAQCVRYTVANAQKVCDVLAKGESWRSVAGTRGYPSYSIFYEWQKAHPEFAEAVEVARRMGAYACMDAAQDVADAATKEELAKARLQVSTLLRRATLMKARPEIRTPAGGAARPVAFYIKQFRVVDDGAGGQRVEEIPPGEDA